MSDKDVDAQFADIIAHWDDVHPVPVREPSERAAQPPEEPYAAGTETTEPSGRAPAAEDAPQAPPGVSAPDGSSPQAPSREASSPSAPPSEPPRSGPAPLEVSWPVWRGADAGAARRDSEPEDRAAVEDDDEHYEPGPTAPLPPQEDLQFWGIIVGLAGGPLLLLWLVLFRPDVSNWWTLFALALTAGGFVLLVLRQPYSRDEDDPDNGARL